MITFEAAPVAQEIEQLPSKQSVVRASRTWGTKTEVTSQPQRYISTKLDYERDTIYDCSSTAYVWWLQ